MGESPVVCFTRRNWRDPECVGGGPAGLYLSILLKLRNPSHDISVHERDPEGSAYGWGVTYGRGLLDQLHAHDPETARAIEENSVRWSEGVAHIRGLTTRRPGDQEYGIGRHRLLEILAGRARSLGVRLTFEHEITPDRNHYIWLGTSKVFDAFTFAFVETDHGWIWCYGYGPEAGTWASARRTRRTDRPCWGSSSPTSSTATPSSAARPPTAALSG